jgi:hypothetical protein
MLTFRVTRITLTATRTQDRLGEFLPF